MQCPTCNGDMWDNRGRKKNPRQPDYKCKDKSCNGVIWPERNSGNGQRSPNGNGKAPVTWRGLASAFEKCHKIALHVYGEKAPLELIHAGTATLMITAQQTGLCAEKAKPAPPPPPPPPPPREPDPVDDMPEDDLPF